MTCAYTHAGVRCGHGEGEHRGGVCARCFRVLASRVSPATLEALAEHEFCAAEAT